MPDAYEIYEARYLNLSSTLSAANALNCASSAVPSGKVWTILSAFSYPSVAETQDLWFSILDRSGNNFHPVVLPQSFAAAPATAKYFPLVREGMELKLFPGERLYAHRGAATAGSTIGLIVRFIESDLPLYRYEEPLRKLPSKRQAHGSSFPRGGGSSGGGGFSGGGPIPPPGGGGGGNPEPV